MASIGLFSKLQPHAGNYNTQNITIYYHNIYHASRFNYCLGVSVTHLACWNFHQKFSLGLPKLVHVFVKVVRWICKSWTCQSCNKYLSKLLNVFPSLCRIKPSSNLKKSYGSFWLCYWTEVTLAVERETKRKFNNTKTKTWQNRQIVNTGISPDWDLTLWFPPPPPKLNKKRLWRDFPNTTYPSTLPWSKTAKTFLRKLLLFAEMGIDSLIPSSVYNREGEKIRFLKTTKCKCWERILRY